MRASHGSVPTRLKQTGSGSGVLGKRVLINTAWVRTGCALQRRGGGAQTLIHAPLEDIMKLNEGAILNSPKDYGTSDDEKALDLTPLSHLCLTGFIWGIRNNRWNFSSSTSGLLMLCGKRSHSCHTRVPSLKPKHNLQAKNRQHRSRQIKERCQTFFSVHPPWCQWNCFVYKPALTQLQHFGIFINPFKRSHARTHTTLWLKPRRLWPEIM